MERVRAQLLLGLALLAFAGCAAPPDDDRTAPEPPTRIVSLDYALTETLLALDVVPVGVPDLDGWDQWVVAPPLPAGVVDVGSTFEPNLELIQQLEPDLILTTPFLGAYRSRLERIAPVHSLSIYHEEGEPYRRAEAVARRLGELLGREAAAEALIARVGATLREKRAELSGRDSLPLYFVRFLDPRHVRVFGEKSLFDDVLERLGIPNAWRGETNYWGFATVGIEALATEDEARLFYFDPVPPDVMRKLERSRIWSSLSFVERGYVGRFPPVLHFGGLPSAERFARLLAERLSPSGPTGD